MSDANSVLPVIVVISATVIFILIIFRFNCLRIRSTIFGQKIDLEASTKEKPKKSNKPPQVIDHGPIDAKRIEDSP